MPAFGPGILGVVALLLTGCATTRLPLCPALAQRSYADGQTPGPLNASARHISTARGIDVEVLSPFTAIFKGSRGDIGWLKANYAQLLCSFEPDQVSNPQSTYMSCLNHAPEWIRVTQSKEPAHLMLQEYLYSENCITPAGPDRNEPADRSE